MRIAIIDLGTNTFHLLIADVFKEKFEILYKTNVPVKLGEGRINDNIIIPSAFERGINALKDFNSTIESYNVSQVKATATSAVRSAQNGQDFVDQAKSLAGIQIEVITGEQEAELIYRGVQLSGAIRGKSLIIDIGGGSVEFILCDKERLIWKSSYNIGAARLMQQFFKSDPISDEDKQHILFHIQSQIKELYEICEIHQPNRLIGSAGAFETFAELIIQKKKLSIDVSTIKTFDFDFENYTSIAVQLLNSSHHERLDMPGMIPLRVDMIVMATLITNYVLGRLKINQLALSTYDLKMGVLAKAMKA